MDEADQELRPLAFGWYGKLPARGDFVGRGLPRAWVRQWDAWLQRATTEAAAALGAAVLRRRLAALAPCQCLVLPQRSGDPAWCGALVGSTDRVGRVFPLLVAESFAWPALGAVDLGELRRRSCALADWLGTARQLDPKELEAGAAPFAEAPLRRPGPDDTRPGMDVHGLCMSQPEAGSFWWQGAASNEPQAQPWPPSDSWLRQLVGRDDAPRHGSDGS
jgi:type VI secretion system protein ImpM